MPHLRHHCSHHCFCMTIVKGGFRFCLHGGHNDVARDLSLYVQQAIVWRHAGWRVIVSGAKEEESSGVAVSIGI